MKTEIDEIRSRVVQMENVVGEIESRLSDLAPLKTKIHATQGDVQELQKIVLQMNEVLSELDKLFKYLKSPGF